MAAGIPLTDDDRWPWLRLVGERLAVGDGVIVACSSLKRVYRDLLCDGHPSVWFAHVQAASELIRDRVEHRSGHYMPASLLDSQLATLEPLQDDEPGAVISGVDPPAQVADHVLTALSKERSLDLPIPEDSP